ncbi:MAG: hypothetical protein IPL16_18480 [Ignavibacteria bacterium]|nr:hypothetical protein [Ignavibacteria bacterium]
MDEDNKKHIKTFKEYLEVRKKNDTVKEEKKVDWQSRKIKWLSSVENLYETVDNIIVKNFKESGFKITANKEKIRLYEEYIGSYEIDNYIIEANNILIKFFPVGTIIIGAFGRVNMLLPNDTVKLVLQDWNDWRIVSGIGSSMKLIQFNEENIVKLFQENV